MATMIYTLSEIENISWNMIDKSISQDTLDLINSLTDQVASPTYSRTPVFNNANNNSNKQFNKRKPKKNQEINAEDWEAIRNFTKTEIVKSEGIQKDIDDIRCLINKITEKTYDKVIERLDEKINAISDNKEAFNASEDKNKIGKAIFTMATSNSFNSNIYSKLCSYLCSKYDFMNDIIINNVNDFMKLFENIEYADPDVDYDRFCNVNIINDNRRAMSLFMCNLFKHKIVDKQYIEKIINTFVVMIEENLGCEEKKMVNDEISQNLFIIISNIDNKILKEFQIWNEVYEYVNKVCNLNLKLNENKGITSKCKFKHLDIKSQLERN
jgi:hypothetical protein